MMQGGKGISQQDAYGKAMNSAVKNTKNFGLIPKKYRGSSPTPVKSLLPQTKGRTMTAKQKAARKTKMIGKAAEKTMFRSIN